MCRDFRGWAAEDLRRHDCDDDGTGSSAPMEDGEGGEDESVQDGAREETPVQEEREPASPRARKCRST